MPGPQGWCGVREAEHLKDLLTKAGVLQRMNEPRLVFQQLHMLFLMFQQAHAAKHTITDKSLGSKGHHAAGRGEEAYSRSPWDTKLQSFPPDERSPSAGVGRTKQQLLLQQRRRHASRTRNKATEQHAVGIKSRRAGLAARQ
jgi:hypothetical protein